MTKNTRFWLLALSLVVAHVVPVNLPGQAGGSDPVTLSPGDVVRLSVWRRPEMSGDFLVAQDGSLTHPLLRQVQVAGIPLPDVDARLREFLLKFDANPEFVASPLIRVAVGGEVRQPNVYNVAPGTTVAQAIAMAGGPTERGRLSEVRVQRGVSAEVVDLTRPTERSVGFEVRSGDQLFVARSRNFLRDVAGPAGGVIAALASLTAVIVQLSR